jgi:hypothetical protein
MVACSGNKNTVIEPILSEASWKDGSTVDYEKGSATILITGETSTQWSAEISQGGEWCSFSSSSKLLNKTGVLSGDLNALYVYYSSNISNKEREAVVLIKMGESGEQVLKLKQYHHLKRIFQLLGHGENYLNLKKIIIFNM